GRGARSQDPVVVPRRARKGVTHGGRKKQAVIVPEAARRRIDASYSRRDNPVAVCVHARDLGSVGIEQPPLQVLDFRLKRCPAFIYIQKDLPGEPARNGALAKLSLFVNIGVKFIRIAWQVRVIADYCGIVLDAPGPRAGNNGLQLAYFAIAEGIRRLSKIIREPCRKR